MISPKPYLEVEDLLDNFKYNDGGRAEAGFKGQAGDCVTRAIAIASGKDYTEIYNELATRQQALGKAKSARNGVLPKVYKKYLEELGFKWVATMGVGTGVTTHLDPNELPGGTIICRLSKHIVAVKDGIIHDTYDPSRGGTRAVYGYWVAP